MTTTQNACFTSNAKFTQKQMSRNMIKTFHRASIQTPSSLERHVRYIFRNVIKTKVRVSFDPTRLYMCSNFGILSSVFSMTFPQHLCPISLHGPRYIILPGHGPSSLPRTWRRHPHISFGPWLFFAGKEKNTSTRLKE